MSGDSSRIIGERYLSKSSIVILSQILSFSDFFAALLFIETPPLSIIWWKKFLE